MLDIDWQQLFGIEKSILELVIRGTVMYWFLFLIFRFIIRRDIGALGIADVLLLVILGIGYVAMAAAVGALGVALGEIGSTLALVVMLLAVIYLYYLSGGSFELKFFEPNAIVPPMPRAICARATRCSSWKIFWI